MKLDKERILSVVKTNKTDVAAKLDAIKSKLSTVADNVADNVRKNKRWTEEENDILRKISEMREKADLAGEEQPDQDLVYEGLAEILGRTKGSLTKHWQNEKLYVSKKINKEK